MKVTTTTPFEITPASENLQRDHMRTKTPASYLCWRTRALSEVLHFLIRAHITQVSDANCLVVIISIIRYINCGETLTRRIRQNTVYDGWTKRAAPALFLTESYKWELYRGFPRGDVTRVGKSTTTTTVPRYYLCAQTFRTCMYVCTPLCWRDLIRSLPASQALFRTLVELFIISIYSRVHS